MTVDAATLRRVERLESQAVGPRDELKLRFNLVKSVLAPPKHAQVTVDFARRRQLQRGGGIDAAAVIATTVAATVAAMGIAATVAATVTATVAAMGIAATVATTVAAMGIAAVAAIKARRQLPSPAND